ncbi:MAG TPA: PA14 domain-containing protein [Planctomycetota bacterium]
MARSTILALLLAACAGSTREGEPAAAPGDAARGFALARELGCASCHAAPGLEAEPAPRIELIGSRLTPGALAASLGAGARMPDCLAGLPAREQDATRAELVHFLASLGGPLVPAAETLDALTIERGRQLYHSVGCVACHEPFERAETLAQPLWEFPDAFEPRSEPRTPRTGPRDPRDLRGLGARTTRAALARYLVDPLAVHPSGRMPSLALGAGEAADLAAYLLYEDAVDAGAVLAPGPGLLLDYYEASFDGETADFDALVPVRSAIATSFFEGIERREEDFGFRFRGLLEIATAGSYRFYTTSDDGSMLYLDGELVVDNRGQHAPDERSGERHLAAGRHAFELTYFEHLGGNELAVHWSGPGFEKRALGFEVLSHLQVRLEPRVAPFTLDPALVERGREGFERHGCANCHTRCGEEAKALGECDPRRGCLASAPRGAAPRYRLTPDQRADLVAAVRAGAPPPRSAAARLAHELARLECGACHARGELPGPSDERRSYFQVARDLDLGDEGRLPPSLERVGAKLKPAWFAEVLERGGRARPYMKTRMPQFGAANVHGLVELFTLVDAPLRDEREPEFSAEAVEAGKLLAGTKGLGCIQCHELAGHPSIGIPAVDLATVHERIYPGWFRELLMDPVALKMNTRMPAFWVDGKSPVKTLYEGDPARQVDALWTYLSLGSSMPLPHGLVPLPGEYEVEVYDEPVCVGVFMAGVSPRTVCVGLPERVHYAFDVEHSRLALAWRGRFLDATGTWHARAGQLEKPAGEDVLEFPSGPLVARLARPEGAWPSDEDALRSCRVLGRTQDAEGRPVFRYRVGDVVVSESIVPEVSPGGPVLRRVVDLQDSSWTPGSPPWTVDLRLAVGKAIEGSDASPSVVDTEGGHLRIDAGRTWFLRVAPEGARLGFRVVEGAGGSRELRTHLEIVTAEPVRVELEYSW